MQFPNKNKLSINSLTKLKSYIGLSMLFDLSEQMSFVIFLTVLIQTIITLTDNDLKVCIMSNLRGQ